MAVKFKVPFNIPYVTGKEIEYISRAIDNGHLSGNGPFTKKCQTFLSERYGFKKALLTTSCTDALEMAAMLIDIKKGDEVIIPSFTFVSTALAFARQGAVIRFIDSRKDHPGLDESQIEMLINAKTRAIIPVHYAGVACDMDKIMGLAAKYNLFVIEDNAHGIESFYKGRPLGSIGQFSCFSFHEAKNIQCGEGGMLAINDNRFAERAEIIWEKGTNRAKFFRGEATFYEWKDVGSSFLSSELNAAFLYAQLENISIIQAKRLSIWHRYNNGFSKLIKKGYAKAPAIPEYSTINGNSFYLICIDKTMRDELINHLNKNGIMVLSHYLPLHQSEYYLRKHDRQFLVMSEKYSDMIVRFPVYHELTEREVDEIIEKTCNFLCTY